MIQVLIITGRSIMLLSVFYAKLGDMEFITKTHEFFFGFLSELCLIFALQTEKKVL